MCSRSVWCLGALQAFLRLWLWLLLLLGAHIFLPAAALSYTPCPASDPICAGNTQSVPGTNGHNVCCANGDTLSTDGSTATCQGSGHCTSPSPSSTASGNIALAGTVFCIDVPGASMVDGVRLALWSPCNLADSENFVFLSDFTIRPKVAQALCIEGAPQQDAALLLKTCHGGANQQFSMLLTGPIVLRANPSYSIAANIYEYPANGVQMQIALSDSLVHGGQHWQTPWTPAFGLFNTAHICEASAARKCHVLN